MANETNPRNFKRQIVLEKQGNKILVLNNKPEDSKCTIDSVNCQITLSQIEFVNEMYSPAHLTVKATLVRSVQQDSQNVQNNPSLPSYQSIVDFFLLAKASVQNEKSDLLESNFYVHEVRPTYVNNNSGNKVILYLDIYSADKLMTLDKYSKSYVHKSLYEGILATEAKRFYVGKDENNKYITVSTRDLSSRLKYSEKDGDTPNIEIKHPYLVQYNESFYDFLIRTANRTGEFLYFAGGQLTLGVKFDKSVTPTKVGKYNSLAVESRNNSVLSTTGISRNYSVKLKETEKHEKSSSGLRYTQPTSNDDYLVVYTKDEFDGFLKEYKPDWRLLTLAFKTLLTTSTIGSFVAALFVNLVPDEMAKSLANSLLANKRYNKQVFEEAPGHDAVNKQTVYSGTYCKKNINDWYLNANADFYNKIDECEKKMGSRTVTITLAAQDEKELPNNYQVGQLIEVVGSRYVVTHVQYSEVFDGSGMRYEHIIKALPLLNVTVDASTKKLVLLLTDESSNSEQKLWICCPAALPEEKRIRKAASQTAWVEDSDDPKFLGRVRIRYAWDNADVNSPWIRQAEPAAGKGGGVNFRLYKDDEVMIGYENDNIEQPYIIGALYHTDDGGVKNGVPVGRNKYIQNTHVIRNRSGHQMIMSELDHCTTFLTGILPTFSFLAPLINFAVGPSDEMSELTGGFQFTDRYGIYNVSMSTDQRLISIASPLGNIKLSAFSGITISAPRGDIAIEGKNVTIKAANKLKLESGENAKPVDNKFAKFKENALGGVVNYAVSLATIDFSVLRHLTEVFLKPVDGTLQIKSYRYLLLEAGKGSAIIPQNGFRDRENNVLNEDPVSYNDFYGGSAIAVKMVQHIRLLDNMVDELLKDYYTLLHRALTTYNEYTLKRKSDALRDRRAQIKESSDAYLAIKKIIKQKKFDSKVLFNQEVPINGNANLRALVEKGEEYWNTLKALENFANSLRKDNWIDKKLKYYEDRELGTALNAAMLEFQSTFSTIILKPDFARTDIRNCYRHINEFLTNGHRGAHPTIRVIAKYLLELRTKKIIEETVPTGEQSIVEINDGDVLKRFASRMDFSQDVKSGKKKFGQQYKEKQLKNLDIGSPFYEAGKWGYDRAKNGRILFSDKEDSTFHVIGGNIEPLPNPNIVKIREIVNTIADHSVFPEVKELPREENAQ